VTHPDRKISETFLHFAAPLVHILSTEAREHRARQALQVAFAVWNAVVFADVLNDHRYLDDHCCPANAWVGPAKQLWNGGLARLLACRDLNSGNARLPRMGHEPWPFRVLSVDGLRSGSGVPALRRPV
jgi:hypothetical protein